MSRSLTRCSFHVEGLTERDDGERLRGAVLDVPGVVDAEVHGERSVVAVVAENELAVENARWVADERGYSPV